MNKNPKRNVRCLHLSIMQISQLVTEEKIYHSFIRKGDVVSENPLGILKLSILFKKKTEIYLPIDFKHQCRVEYV